MPCSLALTVILTLYGCVVVVAQSIEVYKAKIVTTDGRRIRGTLDDVTDQYLYVNRANASYYRRREEISLAKIRKVIIRQNRRRNTLEGAVVGAGLTSFLLIQSSKKSGFRSPVLYGLNLIMGATAGAAAGALIGHSIGSVSARVIRPLGRGSAETVNESLRRQLQPFTYSYQNDLLNRLPP